MRSRAALVVQRVLALAATCLVLAACAADADWETFKQGFLEPDGRIVDTGQARISHSEGQGFAMLFAVHYADRATFDRLWQWTRRHLQVRDDALLAWKWEPQGGVTDRNNAADGDLLVAWALLRAAEKWRQPEYAAAATRIAEDVRKKSMRRSTHGLVLLPGQEVFDKAEGLTINLSYWVYPALRDLARADPAPEWDELARSGIAILQYSYFGRWRLPPDWLRLGERVAAAGPPPERFGFDAMRIPIYLLWSRRDTDVLIKPYRDFWGHFDGARALPGWSFRTHGSPRSRSATLHRRRSTAE